MERRRALWSLGLACLAVTLASVPVAGAGFGIFEQGAKAMGLAGAFTATADDPSALFHNVGGLAFLDEREFQLGLTAITTDGTDFNGAAPFPGEGVTETMESLAETVPHFYWVEPINRAWSFGLAVTAPFGLLSDWDPAGFTGRYISTRAGIVTFDVSPNLGWKVSDKLGLGVGLILRLSEIELNRFEGAVNPFTGVVADIARVELASDLETGLGWQVGMLYRANSSFSWGFHYKAEVDIDFGGDARFTQIQTGFPQFDSVVSTLLPFGIDLPISTTLTFPSSWSVGAAVALSRNWRMEVDYNWVDWDVFDAVVIDFEGALPASTVEQRWEDANSYRVGFQWVGGTRTQWRFGYVFDETPQPLASVGPLLPDADREGFTIGYGRKGNKLTFDVAVMYLLTDERTTLANDSGYNGTWNTTGLLVGTTFGW